MPTMPNCALKLSISFVASAAALESLANFSNREMKSVLFSQMAGRALVLPSLESSGKSAGSFSPASMKLAKTFFASSRLNARLPSIISVATLAAVLLHQIFAGLDGIGLRQQCAHSQPENGSNKHSSDH